MSAAWLAAWAAVATAAIYVVLGIFAFRQVSEARRLRVEQARPYVIVDFAFRQFLIYLEVKNIGRTPARLVSISFDKRLETTLDRPAEIDQTSLFTNPIPMMAPDRRIRVLFDVAHQRLNRDDLPLAYVVTCTYEDMHGRKYADPPATLDLSPYAEAAMEPKSLPDLVDELERVRKELAKWTDGTRGLLVNAVDRDTSSRRLHRWHWRQEGRSIRERDGLEAYLRWVIKRELRRYGWVR